MSERQYIQEEEEEEEEEAHGPSVQYVNTINVNKAAAAPSLCTSAQHKYYRLYRE
jgi:hypothetical protein